MPNLDPKMAMKSIVDYFGTSSVAGPSTRYSSHTSYRLNQTIDWILEIKDLKKTQRRR